MKIPEIDNRSKEDIIQYMKKHLSSYTPEWRFDEDNPDIGTALSLIYANVMSDTIDKLNKVSGKNKVAFLNRLGANLLPAMPAKGYVSFSLVNDEVAGAEVKKNTKLTGNSSDGTEVTFETENHLFVTPAKPDCIFMCEKKQDIIEKLFDRADIENGSQNNAIDCRFFDYKNTASKFENLQEHVLYFSHPYALGINKEAWIFLSFARSRKNSFDADRMDAEFLELFEDKRIVCFEYYTEEGFVEFSEQQILYGQIALKKNEQDLPFKELAVKDLAIDGISEESDGDSSDNEKFFIRCRIKDIEKFQNFFMSRIILRTIGERIDLDSVNAAGIEQNVKMFMPYGERASLYDEVYLVSDEVFSKRGAKVTVEFDVDLKEVLPEVEAVKSEVDWKPLMKRNDIREEREFKIDIEEVIWEYYNGEGFVRLFEDKQYGSIFKYDEELGLNRKRVKLNFTCPMDIEPFLVNASNSACIRVRVLKMNNLFKPNTVYITPTICNMKLSYNYSNGVVPEDVIIRNNLEETRITGNQLLKSNTDFKPFIGRDEASGAIYIGFEKPLVGAPITMYVSLEENILDNMPPLSLEYLSNKKWNQISVVDDTENLRKSGLITIIGPSDFRKKVLFGKERYWIRISDIYDRYMNLDKSKLKSGNKKESGISLAKDVKIDIKTPHIKGIYMNTTPVIAVETMEPELFYIGKNQEHKTCQLKEVPIYEAAVWVNEIKELREKEIEKISEKYSVRFDKTPSGENEAVWVKWEEVPEFSTAKMNQRCYTIDRINGVITFGNGVKGKIPTYGEQATIRVEYKCGGGLKTNLTAGSIDKINTSIGFISGVTNNEITSGGCDQEHIEAALNRQATRIRHGFRAVTERDYENLAMEAARSIEKVKCFANRNIKGELAYGYITLVALEADYEGGQKYFDNVRTQVMNYMKDKMSTYLYSQKKFNMIGPDFLMINVTADVKVKEYGVVFDTRHAILSKLEQFLNPVTGNFTHNGWEIGTIPHVNQILNALKDIPEIQYIDSLRITAVRNNNEEVDLENISECLFILPVNGEHDIKVSVIR